jgi:F420-0:gamma-glutamyl ligase-like protein
MVGSHQLSTINHQPYICVMSEYSISEAMREFLDKSRLKGSVLALQITEVWENIMGKTIARYTDQIEIHGHTLYIQTTVAPLKQELLYKKELIIERVNEALGEKLIREVVIR